MPVFPHYPKYGTLLLSPHALSFSAQAKNTGLTVPNCNPLAH